MESQNATQHLPPALKSIRGPPMLLGVTRGKAGGGGGCGGGGGGGCWPTAPRM